MEKLSRVKKFENYRREIDAMELNPRTSWWAIRTKQSSMPVF